MTEFEPSAPHSTDPRYTGAGQFGDWLTVSEAVIYCSLFGLSRTPKTIRKWAQRSFGNPESAELEVRREDVTHGFRWTVSRTSLDRKIEQELEFEARSVAERGQAGVVTPEPVRTGSIGEANDFLDENPSEPGETGASASKPDRTADDVVDQLRRQIEHLEGEVQFYREELIDRRQSATALVDVIRAFRLNAETNAKDSRDKSKAVPALHSVSNPTTETQGEPPNGNADGESAGRNDDDGASQHAGDRTLTLQVRTMGDNPSGADDYRV